MMVPILFEGPTFNFSKADDGRTLIEAAKSNMAFEKVRLPNLQGINNISISFHFGGKHLCKVIEIVLRTFIVSLVFKFFFEIHNCFINFA